ncbi:MAG TPA: response regulator transcription factor [Polyangiaceae bacterium]
MIRVVLADDHTLVRQGIRALLALVADVELAGEAADGAETVRVVIEKRPHVLLLDLRMPRGDGVFVVQELAARGELPPTLILTTVEDDAAALEVVRAGARGFLLKDVTLERLIGAVRVLAAGGTLIQPGLTARAERELNRHRRDAVDEDEDDEPFDSPESLTEREREILRLLASGYSNREIARALFLVEGTVKNHVSSILAKMGVRDRTRAVLKAADRGLL